MTREAEIGKRISSKPVKAHLGFFHPPKSNPVRSFGRAKGWGGGGGDTYSGEIRLLWELDKTSGKNTVTSEAERMMKHLVKLTSASLPLLHTLTVCGMKTQCLGWWWGGG